MNVNNKAKPITVAIIDSGIDTTKSDLKTYVSASTGYIVNNDGFIIEDNHIEVKNEHGTAIAMVIRAICNNVELKSINILNENLTTDNRILMYSIKKATLLEPDIIHMSLGTTGLKNSLFLRPLIQQARKKNILIVAACSNNGKRSYPAQFKKVIGVKGYNNRNLHDYCYYKGLFYAPIHMKSIRGVECLENKSIVGNSIAAAYITGYLASLKFNNTMININKIKQILGVKKCQISQ